MFSWLRKKSEPQESPEAKRLKELEASMKLIIDKYNNSYTRQFNIIVGLVASMGGKATISGDLMTVAETVTDAAIDIETVDGNLVLTLRS